MKKYLISISIIIILLIGIESLIFFSILTHIMTDEAVHVPLILRILGFISSCPIILINEDWPWNVKTAWVGIITILINLLIQAHTIYFVMKGISSLRKGKRTS